jgi:hypothetical protein
MRDSGLDFNHPPGYQLRLTVRVKRREGTAGLPRDVWSARTTFLNLLPNDVLLWKAAVEGREAAVLKLHELGNSMQASFA